jgi:curved DNA-binding protein
VLKDPETRKRYDLLGASWKHGAPFEPPPQWRTQPGEAHGRNVRVEFGGFPGGAGGFSDFFSAFMGGSGGQGVRFEGRRAGAGPSLEDLLGSLGGDGGAGFSGFPGDPTGAGRASAGQDLQSELTIELEDAVQGRPRSIELSGPEGSRRYEVKIPRGIRDGERIRLGGQGRSGAGGARGDLYLTVRIAPHPLFRVEGDDLVVVLPVRPWDAALGGPVRVRTLDGEVTLTLPPGVSSGQRLRLRGKGLPRRSGGAGDLHAEVQITVPRTLSAEQRRLFAKLREVSAPSDQQRASSAA